MKEPAKMKCDKCGKMKDVPLMKRCVMLVNMIVCCSCCDRCYYNNDKGECTFQGGK